MSQVLFEGRFLVSMIGTLLHKGSLNIRYGRMDWERLFRTADYHRVANIIYLGILGNGGRVSERWMNRFFERYQECLIHGDSCEPAEKEILTLLDMEEISCIVLSSSTLRGLYEVTEMAELSPLKLYINPDSYTRVKGYLVDLGYETIRNYGEYGERMHRLSGLNVDIYRKLPFQTRFYEKGMRDLMLRARVRNNGKTVRIFSAEDRLIYRLASVSYQYVTDELMIRDMLDLFLYHKAWRRRLDGEYITKKLQDFRVDLLAYKILRLSYMWFGEKEDKEYMQSGGQLEDVVSFDVLENRILSRGEMAENAETDPQALGLLRLLQKEEEREARRIRRQSFHKRAEERKKSIKRFFQWVFPDYKYMASLYPNLEKVPFLLPLYWLFRGMRLLAGMIKKRNQQP